MPRHRIFTTPFASVHPHYVAKAERKGRTRAEVDEVICWLTGYDAAGLAAALDELWDVETFFDRAPAMTPHAALITGTICGIRVEEVDDPLMRRIRMLDELVDEVAQGRPMSRVLRGGSVAQSVP
ncbi:MAG: hypothetical protein AVDCRST_MAG35-2201 [uncultured Quadrisphaera sp.]|uniref:DUF2200 domain-containing protein n=1 Tax=uncultured Quadrisphaera sp. TaxID=904978 RepID=A0A6J4Q0C4_9ACTN|nr:MAG: hypothetical protein AVDCRST_MAG35-2201 [uncultured Quadrisphaera sp.]